MKRQVQFLSADEKTMIEVSCWYPQQQPVATLQIVHGMVEFIERYDLFADYLNQKGIIVMGHDHLGHGHSIQSKEYFGHFADKNGSEFLLSDIHTVNEKIKEQYPTLPHFILGHSMGSFLVRNYLAQFETDFSGVIIMGTGWHNPKEMRAAEAIASTIVSVHGAKYRSKFLDQLAFGGFNRQFEPARTSKDWLTRDQIEVDKYLFDPRTQFIFTAASYKELFRLVRQACSLDQVKQISDSLPMLVISGAKDPVGANGRGVRTFIQAMKEYTTSQLTLLLYEEARHELLNEINQEVVYQDLYFWLKKYIDTY